MKKTGEEDGNSGGDTKQSDPVYGPSEPCLLHCEDSPIKEQEGKLIKQDGNLECWCGEKQSLPGSKYQNTPERK